MQQSLREKGTKDFAHIFGYIYPFHILQKNEHYLEVKIVLSIYILSFLGGTLIYLTCNYARVKLFDTAKPT